MEKKLVETEDLKEKLYPPVDESENGFLVNELNEAEAEYEDSDLRNSPDYLNPRQLDRLKESLRQLDAGLGIPWEEFLKIRQSWLKQL